MRRTMAVFQILLVLIIAGLPFRPAVAVAAAAPYKIIFANVGQGDAALLIDPDGFAVLIDGGKTSAGPGLVALIRAQGIADIDVMVATHPDSDHIGGLIDVLQMADVPVLSVLYNGYPGATATWTNFVSEVQAEGLSLTTVTYPNSLAWGAISATVLNPAAGLANPESNAACLALLVQTGSVRTVFTCDLDAAQESVVLGRGVNLDADLLKVAHHGSAEGSSQAFLDAVTPLEAIISVGDNSYGHPDPAVIARLEDSGARVWRTDQSGHITVQVSETGYTVAAEITTPMHSQFLPLMIRQELAPAGTLVINAVFYDGTVSSAEPDEYVEFTNHGPAQELQGWSLSDNQGSVYTFPGFLMQPGQACRVYTNQSHPDSCGFNYGSGTAIWNNSGDCAMLRNPQGQEVSKKCYP